MTAGLRIFTIGHSTRTVAEFLALLEAHGVTAIADVRTVPRSRRHPHFAGEAMARWLPERGIAYRHFPGLGGLRRPKPDSANTGWRHPSFRAYADHMESPEFHADLEELLALARKSLAAVMCAESKWWECHRQLIADALLARGVEVLHIMSAADARPHRLTPFARITGTDVRYPGLIE